MTQQLQNNKLKLKREKSCTARKTRSAAGLNIQKRGWFHLMCQVKWTIWSHCTGSRSGSNTDKHTLPVLQWSTKAPSSNTTRSGLWCPLVVDRWKTASSFKRHIFITAWVHLEEQIGTIYCFHMVHNSVTLLNLKILRSVESCLFFLIRN